VSDHQTPRESNIPHKFRFVSFILGALLSSRLSASHQLTSLNSAILASGTEQLPGFIIQIEHYAIAKLQPPYHVPRTRL
jgi:hypothetical protein